MTRLKGAHAFFLVLLLAGCGSDSGEQTQAAAAPKLTAEAAATELNKIVEAYWDRYIELNPLVGTFNGDYRFNDRIENTISPQYLADTLAMDREFLAKLDTIEPASLSGQDRLTYDTFRLDRQLGM